MALVVYEGPNSDKLPTSSYTSPLETTSSCSGETMSGNGRSSYVGLVKTASILHFGNNFHWVYVKHYEYIFSALLFLIPSHVLTFFYFRCLISSSRIKELHGDLSIIYVLMHYLNLMGCLITQQSYLNGLLQTLFMTPEFRRAVLSWPYHLKDGELEEQCIPLQLQRLFGLLQLSKSKAVDTVALTKYLCSVTTFILLF